MKAKTVEELMLNLESYDDDTRILFKKGDELFEIDNKEIEEKKLGKRYAIIIELKPFEK